LIRPAQRGLLAAQLRKGNRRGPRDRGAEGGLEPLIENWSLTSLQQRLVKTGGRLVKHARYYW